MRKHILLLCSIILTAGLVGTVFAQEPPKKDEAAKDSPKRPNAEQMFANIDADGDGSVSKEEFQAHFEKMTPLRGPRFDGSGPRGEFGRGEFGRGPGFDGRGPRGEFGRGEFGRGPGFDGRGEFGRGGFGPGPAAMAGRGPMRHDFGPQMVRHGFDGGHYGSGFVNRGHRNDFRHGDFKHGSPRAMRGFGGKFAPGPGFGGRGPQKPMPYSCTYGPNMDCPYWDAMHGPKSDVPPAPSVSEDVAE